MSHDYTDISDGAERLERLERDGSDGVATADDLADNGAAGREHMNAAKASSRAAENMVREEHGRGDAHGGGSKKRRAPGFGGWLAAVISLGTACLVLATIVTYGWINLSALRESMAGIQTQSLYELNAIVDNLDSNLAKARVASSSSDRVQVLADIAIESQMAEVVLERLPLDYTFTSNMAAFINRMGDSARSMLRTAAAGGEFEGWQRRTIEYMYHNNAKLKRALNEMVSSSGEADIHQLLGGRGGVIEDGFTDIRNNVIEEPRGIFDGPFSDKPMDTNISFFEGLEEVSAEKAESAAAELFADYGVTRARCTGEAKLGGMAFYNVVLECRDGEMMAQISRKGGRLVMFDSYKECGEHNFSVERCVDIARDFLAEAGYENVEPVWVSENGTACNINFCYVQDGVVVYPDMIKVKVCEERGLVTGAEAIGYILNHSQRHIAGATITCGQAQSAIDGRMEVRASRLAVIPSEGGERLCYEFSGTFGGRDYFVYVDAATGEEVSVLTVVGTAQGRAVL